MWCIAVPIRFQDRPIPPVGDEKLEMIQNE